MKQTAVEWMIEQLAELDKQLDGRRKNDDSTVIKLNPIKIYEQAKEMERQQMAESFNLGTWNGGSNVNFKNGKEYYDKTYGGEK